MDEVKGKRIEGWLFATPSPRITPKSAFLKKMEKKQKAQAQQLQQFKVSDTFVAPPPPLPVGADGLVDIAAALKAGATIHVYGGGGGGSERFAPKEEGNVTPLKRGKQKRSGPL